MKIRTSCRVAAQLPRFFPSILSFEFLNSLQAHVVLLQDKLLYKSAMLVGF